MKWLPRISMRAKAGVSLGVILLAVLGNNLWERNNIEELDRSVSSIYDDRLIPATHVFQLTDHMYKKRLLWSEAEQPGRAEELRAGLDTHDAAIAAVVKEFEATYLVAEESRALAGFKARWAACRELEQRWAAAPSADLRAAMSGEFDEAVRQLGLLSQIQQHVGKDLKQGSKSLLASSTVLSELEISLLLVVCLLLQILLVPSKPGAPLSPRQSPLG